jgi:nitrate reductase beta subunit
MKRAADRQWKADWRRSKKYYDQKSKSGIKIQQLELSHAFASAPERKSYLEPFQLGGLAKNMETENPRVDMDM